MKIHAVDGDVSVMELIEGTNKVVQFLAAVAEQRHQDVQGLSSFDVACFMAIVAPGLLTTLVALKANVGRMLDAENIELSAAVERMLQEAQ
jgi:hypothetical protein